MGGLLVHTLVDLAEAFLEGQSVRPGEAVSGPLFAAVDPPSPSSWTIATEAEIKYSNHSSYIPPTDPLTILGYDSLNI